MPTACAARAPRKVGFGFRTATERVEIQATAEREAFMAEIEADLPIVPDNFKLVVRDERSKKQMSVVTKQLKRADVDLVINAADAGRDAALLVNDGTVNPRGSIEAGDVTIRVGETLFVQNSGSALDFAGITVRENTLTIVPTGSQPIQAFAFYYVTRTVNIHIPVSRAGCHFPVIQ